MFKAGGSVGGFPGFLGGVLELPQLPPVFALGFWEFWGIWEILVGEQERHASRPPNQLGNLRRARAYGPPQNAAQVTSFEYSVQNPGITERRFQPRDPEFAVPRGAKEMSQEPGSTGF